MTAPQVNIPYDLIGEYYELIKEQRLNLEIFFSATALDNLEHSDVVRLKESLVYGPAFTMHAPFMDLSPGAVDPRIRAVTFERFMQAFDVAEILMPRTIVFHSGYEKWKYDHKVDVWLEESLKTWRKLAQRALAVGAVIAVENIFEDTPDNLELLMREVGSDNIGICFDAGHFNIFSKEPLSRWLDSLGPYLVELHLHDNDKSADSHLALGEGTFDFAGLFKALEGRDVVYTIEAHTPAGVVKSLDWLRDYKLST
jgi:sugar phosphate isomerase/epimerase